MSKTELQSVDAYIAAQPEPRRALLQTVRSAIRRALPEAEELIAYQMPAYKVRGERVLYFAAWKKHYSLYPITESTIAAFKDELAPYEINHKGTMRLPYTQSVPEDLIERIARSRGEV